MTNEVINELKKYTVGKKNTEKTEISVLALNRLISALKEQEPKTDRWIPLKTRPLSDKEKEEYADLGYSEDAISFMYDCPLPDDGQEVLVTTRYGEVTTDTFYRDEGCYFETYCDEDDIKAWMPKPKSYEPQESEEV